MRIAGGSEKGRRLQGATSPKTRATTERVRSAIFNILDLSMYEGGKVLDLFAGTGSLGIEALSRGAGSADFVEWDRRQSAVIENNLKSAGFASRGHVHCVDVMQALLSLPGNYDLVLMDPPYRMDGLDGLLERIAGKTKLIVEGGVLVAGHSKHETLREKYELLRLTSHRQYGDNVVDFFVYERNSTSELTECPDIVQDRYK